LTIIGCVNSRMAGSTIVSDYCVSVRPSVRPSLRWSLTQRVITQLVMSCWLL